MMILLACMSVSSLHEIVDRCLDLVGAEVVAPVTIFELGSVALPRHERGDGVVRQVAEHDLGGHQPGAVAQGAAHLDLAAALGRAQRRHGGDVVGHGLYPFHVQLNLTPRCLVTGSSIVTSMPLVRASYSRTPRSASFAV